MMQVLVQVTGILLVVLTSSCAAQNSSTDQPPAAAAGSNFAFDCRRSDGSCSNNNICNLNTGKCACTGTGEFNYKCDPVTSDTSCSPGCANGYCSGGSCICDESHYGSDCSLDRVHVLCEKNKMLININPTDNFQGLIYLLSNSKCILLDTLANIATQIVTVFTGDKITGIRGRFIIFPSTSIDCGSGLVCAEVTVKSNPGNESPATDGIRMIRAGNDVPKTVQVYIQYNPQFKSSVDQIVTAQCASDDNVTISSNVTNVGDSVGGLDQVNNNGKADQVVLTVKGKGGSPLRDPAFLGDELHLTFSLPVTAASIHKDFQLLLCWANSAADITGSKTITFLTDGCPEHNAASLFSGLPTKTRTSTLIVIDVALKVFKFLDSSVVVFFCTVGFCNDNAAVHCQQKTCSGYSSSATQTPPPTNTGQPNTTNPTNPTTPPTNTTTPANSSSTPALRRKRQATDGDAVNTTITVRDPNDNSTTEPVAEKPTTTTDVCVTNHDIIAVIAILGVCVFLLLITTIMLIFCLNKSNKKPDPGQLDRFPRPEETRRFPRLEMQAAQHNGY